MSCCGGGGIRYFVISFHFINSKRAPPACFQFAYSVLHAFDSFWCIGSFFYCLQGFFQRGNFFLTLQNHRNWQEESRGGSELETVLSFKGGGKKKKEKNESNKIN